MKNKSVKKQEYHHGDLRNALLEEAMRILQERGLEKLSLKTLSDRLGVSRMALYHHFENKHALLCELAARGFETHGERLIQSISTSSDVSEGVRLYTRTYIDFALEHPALYDLMYGRQLWQGGVNTAALVSAVKRIHDGSIDMLQMLKQRGVVSASLDPEAFQQFATAILHGMARLMIDGVFADRKRLQSFEANATAAMCQQLLQPASP